MRVVVGLILIGLLIFYVDGTMLISYLRNSQQQWLFATASFILCSTIIGGYNLYILLDRYEDISFYRFIRGYWVAWAVGLVVPGQVGDVASISIWLKHHGFQWYAGIGCTLLDKFISLIWMCGLGLSGFVLYFSASYEDGYVISLVISGIAFVLLLLLLLLFFRWHGNSKYDSAVIQTLQVITATIRHHKKQVIYNFIFTGIKVFLIGAAFWSAFFSMGYHGLDITILIPLVAASSLVAYIPISLNGMGTVELAALGLFSVLDVPNAAILSVFLTMRITVLLLAWVPVSLFMVFSGGASTSQ